MEFITVNPSAKKFIEICRKHVPWHVFLQAVCLIRHC